MSSRLAATAVAFAVALTTGPAMASPQVWPFQFDPNLAPDPAKIKQSLATGGAALPPLPVSRLQTLVTDNGAMTLWLWPENVALLQRIGASGPGLMTWPTAAQQCAQHAAFTMPSLAPGAPASCGGVLTQLEQALSSTNLSACLLAEQPERYVTDYSPKDYAKDVGNIEDMIGLVGEALTHAGPPAAGLLPPDWVPTMRTIVAKIRHPKLLTRLKQANAGYAQATSLVSSNTACFGGGVATITSQLAGLTTEVAAMTTSLTALEQAGEAASALELQCLSAQSRSRMALPYPGLTRADREFLAFWLGGLYWRLRGGGLIPLPGTQEARLYYVFNGFGQIGALLGGSDGQSIANGFFTELLVDGWAQYQGMGLGADGSGNDRYVSIIGMSERGQRQAQAGINALQPLGYDTADLLTSGLLMGPGYYYGRYPLADFRYGMNLTSPYSNFMDWSTAIGEFSIGTALGLGLAKTLLPGKPSGQPATNLCAGKVCGDDGCGGSCGTCPGGTTCDLAGSSCVAQPDAGNGATDPEAPGAASGPGKPATERSGSEISGCSSQGVLRPNGIGSTLALLGIGVLGLRRGRRRGAKK